jgi:hypothetical protein
MVKAGVVDLRVGLSSIVVGSICAATAAVTPSKADAIADRIIQNVIQNILQDVRDQIQSRRLATYSPGRLQFTGEDANSALSVNDPFAALAYAKAPYTKAPPVPPVPPPPTYLYGLNLTGSGDSSSAAGITTTSYGVTGAVDITKIGIFKADDAVSVIFTGSGIWSNSPGINSNTSVGAGTIAYVSGGFSTDFTIDGTWTSSSLSTLGIATTDSTGISYAPNVQYKFELGNGFYIEPTVGVTYTQVFSANFGNQMGDSTEIHGGARFGTETVWNNVRVQPSLTLAAFSITEQTGMGGTALPPGAPGAVASGAVQTGTLGGRASGKLNILWTNNFSSFVEAHGSGIGGTSAYGATGGLRWSF